MAATRSSATQRGAAAGRLCRHRSRLRRRSRRGKILRHQVPAGGAEARRGGRRGDRARAENERRRRQGAISISENLGRARGGPRQSRAPCRRTCGSSGSTSSSRSTVSTPTRDAELELIRRFVARKVRRARRSSTNPGRRGAAGAEALARAVVETRRPLAARFPAALSRRPAADRKDARHRARDLPRRGHRRRRRACAKRFDELEEAGFGRAADLRRQDAIFVLRRSRAARRARAATSRKSTTSALRAGAGFVVVFMGDITTMPGLPRVPAAENIRVVDGRIEGLF